ncbi:MAG: alpha/beta hydrolase family protein, partial [Gemmatimonadaceae bacterium]
DVTDPLGQSQEMYRALRQEGVPVKLVTFPRESHGGLGGGIAGGPSREPWHGFEARQQIVGWFTSHFPKR